MTQEKTNLKGKAEAEPTPAPVAEEPQPAAAPKSKKTPIEDGFVAPVEFAKHLSEQQGEIVPPQMVYGYLKNVRDFPQKDRGEGVTPRIVIPLKEGLEFMSSRTKVLAEKKQQKAQAAKEALEKAAAAAAPATETA